MSRVRALTFLTALAVIAAPARPEVSLPTAVQVLGNVTNAARPISKALVIALNLNSFDAIQTYSLADGSFVLPPLTAGVYKIIAIKQGFVPATATIVGTKADHRVTLRLQSEAKAKGRSAAQEIWEIRGSLPPDILREVDLVLAENPPAADQFASYEMPRLRGEMFSMTAVANQEAAPAFAQTAVGVQSRLGDNWQIGLRGDLQRFTDAGETVRDTLAETSVMEMELRSSPRDSYRVATTRSMWQIRDGEESAGSVQAGLRSHNFEWNHGDASVKVRYFEHDNLFRSADDGADVIEIGGDTTVLQTRRSDVGVSLRVRQESLRAGDTTPMRTADLSANGRLELVPSFVLHYGMASRLGIDHSEVSPSTGLEWRFTKDTALVASAAYKVHDEITTATLPSLVVWTDDYQLLPRYSYSVGIVSTRNEQNRLSAIVTVSAADAPMRVVFNEGAHQFWDGLLVDAGDIRRDIRIAYRRDIGSIFAIDLATTAGTATSTGMSDTLQKVYITGDLQTIFTPTGTTLAVSYREIQQPQVQGAGDYSSERVNLRMAQSLYLPIDVKLLLGVEMARVQNSPFLLDSLLEDSSRKYLGGLALNF
jgi:hypothetical protein